MRYSGRSRERGTIGCSSEGSPILAINILLRLDLLRLEEQLYPVH